MLLFLKQLNFIIRIWMHSFYDSISKKLACLEKLLPIAVFLKTVIAGKSLKGFDLNNHG
jgi:hypothetical protein